MSATARRVFELWRVLRLTLLVCVAFILFAPPLHGQVPSKLWGETGLPVSIAFGPQTRGVSTSDGAGGIIVAWEDGRTGWTGYGAPVPDISVQRLSGSGTPLWTLDGVRLTNDAAFQTDPVLAADGAGGVIVAWSHAPQNANWNVYAQRVAGDGEVLWQAGGVPVGAFGGPSVYDVRIATDGAGGAILAWAQAGAIRAQRINPDGTLGWSAGGVVVIQSAASIWPEIATDGAGGVFVSWQDLQDRSVCLFAQRLDATGSPAWPAGGILVASMLGSRTHQIIADGARGAILAWVARRDATIYDAEVFGQRLDRDGAALWIAGGLAICTRDHDQQGPVLTTDGAGGAIFAWVDQGAGWPDGGQWIMAQHVDAGGAVAWAANGVVVSDRHSLAQRLIPDGDGGVLIVWDGFHETPAGLGWPAIFAQRLDSTGQRVWSSAGLEVYALPTGHYGFGPQPVSDGAGGLIVHWTDYRFTGGDTYDIFAQRISDRVPPSPSTPADLSVTLEASPNPVAGDGNLTYVATVTNAGPGAATLVAFNNDIPPATRIYLATTTRGSCALESPLFSTLSCQLGTMAPGTSAEMRFVVRAPAGLPTVVDAAFVSSNERDPDPTNNEATEVTTITPGFGPPPTSFFTLTPCRVLDTRGRTDVWGGPALQSGSTRYFPLVGRCDIPPTAISVSVNITVTEPTRGGHLIVYPSDITRPTSSSINYSVGQTRANNAVVRLSDFAGDHGAIEIYGGLPGPGSVHVIIDVNGYFE